MPPMTDQLVRYISADDHACTIVDCLETARTIGVEQHGLSGRPLAVLARGVVSAVLLGTRMKGRGVLTWQLKTEGLFRQLRVDVMGQGLARAMVTPETEQDLDAWNGVDQLLGEGELVVTTQLEGHVQPYTTQLAVTAEHVDGVTNDYLVRSAQVAAVVRSDVRIEGGELVEAKGVYLERLPGAAEESHRVEEWREAGPGSLDLVSPGSFDATADLLNGAGNWKRLREDSVEFFCLCSRERYRDTLRGFPPDELRQLANGHGIIEATCDFCRTTYEIALDDLL